MQAATPNVYAPPALSREPKGSQPPAQPVRLRTAELRKAAVWGQSELLILFAVADKIQLYTSDQRPPFGSCSTMSMVDRERAEDPPGNKAGCTHMPRIGWFLSDLAEERHVDGDVFHCPGCRSN